MQTDESPAAVAESIAVAILSTLRPVLEIELLEILADRSAHFLALRAFFLEPQDTWSVEELAALWEISVEDVREVFSDELAESKRALPVTWANALWTGVTYNYFRPIDVERALGADFARMRPESWLTVPLLIHVPRFMVDTLWSGERSQSASVEQFLFESFQREHREAFGKS